MTATVWDSVTPNEIPSTAQIVAGYVDGEYAWSAADWHRLGAAQHVTITVFGNQGARVADVENGDLTATQAARWCQVELDAGRRPTLYSATSTWTDEIQPALAAIGEFPAAIDWWAADPTGVPHLYPGSVATQYAWNAFNQTDGLNVDLSMTNGTWPGSMVPDAPKPPPPAPVKPSFVGIAHCPTGGYWAAASDGGVFTYGPAKFYGSLGGKVLSAPIVDIAAAGATGYYLIGADGAVYAFGSAIYYGRANL